MSELLELLEVLVPDDEGMDRQDNACYLFLDVAGHVNNAVWHKDEAVRELAKRVVRAGNIPQALILMLSYGGDYHESRYSSDTQAETAFDNMCFAWRENEND